jgi:thiol-disulfide isomerase/thioredoxin
MESREVLRESLRVVSRCAAAGCVVVLACGEPEPPVTVVRGTLLGHDGQPMLMGHVHLFTASDFFRTEPFESVEVGEDGSYEFRTERVGLFLLKFSGVDHANVALPFVAEPPLDLGVNVQLPTYAYNDEFGGVKIFGDFNEWDFESALPMEAQPDGTYSVTIETDADSMAYGLINVIQGLGQYAINGTQSDGFAYSGRDSYHYRSVVGAPEGRVTIVFDPAKLVRSDTSAFAWEHWSEVSKKAVVAFEDSSSTFARLNPLVSESQERYMAFLASLESTDTVEFDLDGMLAELTGKASVEEDQVVRHALFLEVLRLADSGADIDAQLRRRALAEVPPTAPIWSMYGYMVNGFVAAGLGGVDSVVASAPGSGQVEDCSFDEYMTYLEEGVDQHPDSVMQSLMLFGMVGMASEAGREDLVVEHYQRLRDGYPESLGAYFVKPYAPDKMVKVGNRIPDFALVSLDDPDVTYTRESLSDRVYFLDFWATWCLPCVAELETLHQVYEEFAPRGLEILSVSFDGSSDAVRDFREQQWPMPWLHTHVGNDIRSDPVKPFEVVGIPNGILVDSDGTIVAAGTDLVGETLRQTLTEFFGEST